MPKMLLMAFQINEDPVAKGRPRWSGKINKTYTPERTRKYEKLVSSAATQATFASAYASLLPVDKGVPIEVVMTFYLHRPKRLMRKKDPPGPIPHTGRPDLDNLIKALIDGIDRSDMVWDDDGQVCHKLGYKYYHAKNDKPHTLVQVYLVDENGQD